MRKIAKLISGTMICLGLVACAGANENMTSAVSNVKATGEAAPVDDGETATLGLVKGETINLSGVGMCRVAQANGVELHKSNLSRNDCIAKCASFEATNPGRSCTHMSGILRVAPRQVCQIVGAAGVVHFYALAGRMRCGQECNKYGNPNRQCLWGGVSVKP